MATDAFHLLGCTYKFSLIFIFQNKKKIKIFIENALHDSEVSEKYNTTKGTQREKCFSNDF